MNKPRESDTLKAILQYLEMRGILYFRMNSGDRFGSYKGKTWRIRGHQKGTADILVFKKESIYLGRNLGTIPEYIEYPLVCWVECKSALGKQSLEQKQFQQRVEEWGHIYIVARNIDDVRKVVG